MKKIIITLICVLFVIPSLSISFGQEQMQYFLNTFKSGDDCLISHVYSTKLYVPAQVKIYHDATPTFSVSTNSTTIGAQITPLGSDNNVYIENVINSTAQFSIQVYAKYADGKEHPFLIEFWSQNAPMSADQYSTTNSQFCHTIMIDTAQPPVIPDVGIEVKKVTQSLLGQFVSIVSQNTVTLFYSLVFDVIFSLIVVIVLIVIGIKMGTFQDINKATNAISESMLKKLNKNIVIYNSDRRLARIEQAHIMQKIKLIEDKNEKFQSSFLSEFEITFRSLFLDCMRKFQKEQIESNPAKNEEMQKEIKTISEEKIEEPENLPFKTPDEISDVEPSTISKIVDVMKKPTQIFDKEPKITRTEEEWYSIWEKESDDTKLENRLKEVLDKYEKLTDKTDADNDLLHESHALHKLLMKRYDLEY